MNSDDLFRQQREIRRRRRARIAAVIALSTFLVGGGIVATLLLLVRIGEAGFESRLEQSRGKALGDVRYEIGPPGREWSSAAFSCDADFPCAVAPLGGDVLLYRQGRTGWYLAFDSEGRLGAFERATARP